MRSIRNILVATALAGVVALATAMPAAAHIEELDITAAFLDQDGTVNVRVDVDCTQVETGRLRIRVNQKGTVGESDFTINCPSSPDNVLGGEAPPTEGSFRTGRAVICAILTTELQGVRHDREKVCETITIQ